MTELLDIATRVAGWANAGEQVEAFVVHESETEVRAYEGEIESLHVGLIEVDELEGLVAPFSSL